MKWSGTLHHQFDTQYNGSLVTVCFCSCRAGSGWFCLFEHLFQLLLDPLEAVIAQPPLQGAQLTLAVAVSASIPLQAQRILASLSFLRRRSSR